MILYDLQKPQCLLVFEQNMLKKKKIANTSILLLNLLKELKLVATENLAR